LGNKAYPSTESLGGFGGDISAASDSDDDEDEEEEEKTEKGKEMERNDSTISWPRRGLLLPQAAGSVTSLGSSVTSLPDLVTSSEVRHITTRSSH